MMEESIRLYPKHIILCDNKPVGCVSCHSNAPQEYEIGCLCVIPEYQGKGIGTQAIQFVGYYYDDWKRLSLITPLYKHENVRFYTEKCGFQIPGTEKDGNIELARFFNGEINGFFTVCFQRMDEMDLSDCYLEEDLFPRIFTGCEERSYGILFYDEDNKDSFDSNHAVIYKDKTEDLPGVLSDIVYFYRSKDIRPIIYQSMLDDNWFGNIREDLAAAGFRSWVEDQEYMLPSGENLITPNPEVEVRKVTEWKDELEQVFLAAEEPWEIKVARKTLEYPKAWMFAAYLEGKPVGLLYGHISERACRVDYLLVSKKHRKAGVGRTLFYQYMEWCKGSGIENIYIWPDGDTPKKIYEEGGFRIIETRKAGRAVFEAD